MDSMEYIDDYFKNAPTGEQKQQFEQRIVNDILFAEEVAFYISANSTLKQQLLEDKKKRFRELYDQQKRSAHQLKVVAKKPVIKWVRYLAAASVIAAVVFLGLMKFNSSSPDQLASGYIKEKFTVVSVTMGNLDSLQNGLRLLNDNKLNEALTQFESILKSDSSSEAAKKFAGIASLRLQQYDKALQYFSSLANDTLESNPGKFYEALTLLKRNGTGDLEAAKKLLQEVKEKDLVESGQAAEWLKKL